MSSEERRWEARSIERLIDAGILAINDGYRAKNAELGEDGLPFARAGNVNGSFDFGNADRLAWQYVEKAASKRSRAGDVVFTSKGTVGRFAFVHDSTPEFVYSPQLCFWRIHDSSQIVPRFLHYWMHGSECQHQFHAAKGSTDMADYISLRDQRRMFITLPPIEEQSRIARILGSLDDKIENNRRIAETLERIAATLFKARFVDFVDHDDLVESEIGPIPRGWSAMPVGDLASYVNGKAFTKFGNGRGRMVIRIAELKSGPGGATVYTDHDADPEFIAEPGDMLFAWSGSLDVYRWHREQALINQHIFKVVPRGYPKWFVYYALKLVMPEFQAIASDKATTMGHIKRSHLTDFAVAVPPAGELGASDKVFEPLFDLALQARIEIETLARIRDLLLPRLVSGQIRVPADAFPDEDAA
jgi:type I restriction enzyme S subunit